MSSANNHIVSRLRWDTSFDNKSNAVDLQNRLNDWSNAHFHRELSAVFDAFCPQGQIWQINSLELELGTIELEQLEKELPEKIKTRLREILTEMVLNVGINDSQELEMLDENASQVEILGNFLLNGVMPWTCKPSGKTLDELMERQLQQNRRQTMQMISENGAAHEQVLKRIAWQFSEYNVDKIIENLEPGNHRQIIDFADELAKIQVKETIVQTSSAELRKNLRHWILNYLLTERGSIFNKMAFMRSNIRQMSQHYNISYDSLLTMIYRAAEEVNRRMGIRTDFLRAIHLLAAERNEQSDPYSLLEDEKDIYQGLYDLFINSTLRRSEPGKSNLKMWVEQLQNESNARFRTLISSVDHTHWPSIIADLDEESFEIILSAQAREHAEEMKGVLHFIAHLSRQMKLPVSRKSLRESSILFLLKNNGSWNEKAFIRYCVSMMTGRSPQFRMLLMERMTEADVLPAMKTAENVVLFSHLKELLFEKLPGSETEFVQEHLANLLQRYTAHTTDNETLIRVLHNYIIQHPRVVWNLLQQYPQVVKQIHLLSNEDLIQLIKQAPQEIITAYHKVEQLLATYKPKLLQLLTHWQKTLLADSLKISLQRASTSATQWLEQLLEVWIDSPIIADAVAFSDEVRQLLAYSELQNIGISAGTSSLLLEKIKLPKEQQEPIKEASRISLGDFSRDNTLSHDIILTAIKNCLAEETRFFADDNGEVYIEEQLPVILENDPLAFCKLLADVSCSPARIRLLETAFSFDVFCKRIGTQLPAAKQQMLFDLAAFYECILSIAPSRILNIISRQSWVWCWKLLAGEPLSGQDLEKMLVGLFSQLVEDGTSGELITAELSKNKSHFSTHIMNVLSKQLAFPGKNKLIGNTQSLPSYLQETPRMQRIEAVLNDLIQEEKISLMLPDFAIPTKEQLLNDIVEHCPLLLLTFLKKYKHDDTQIKLLTQAIPFAKLTVAAGNTDKSQQPMLLILTQLYKAFGQIDNTTISTSTLQHILYRKLFKAWTGGNWKLISANLVWNEILWEASARYGIPAKTFTTAMEKIKWQLAPALQLSWKQFTVRTATAEVNEQKQRLQKLHQKRTTDLRKHTIPKTGIPVKNAGLVLISSYMPMLFERLGILEERRFKDGCLQEDAVHYLQYVGTGISRTEEVLLPLNKVLCGLPLSHSLADSITITESHKKLIEGLIQAMIGHWPQIGKTSVDGFRGNWLVRDGLLTEHDDKWELHVEKRPYDMLIHKSPFSFSIIRHPWMEKPLHVNWSY